MFVLVFCLLLVREVFFLSCLCEGIYLCCTGPLWCLPRGATSHQICFWEMSKLREQVARLEAMLKEIGKGGEADGWKSIVLTAEVEEDGNHS
jgi:hypothetical protein